MADQQPQIGPGEDAGEETEPQEPRGARDRSASSSGTELKAVYRPEDVADLPYEEAIGDPGEYPFTRGVYRTMYRGRLWTMRQYAGYGTARETNRRFRYLLEHGQTGLSTAFDLPTQMGYDPDQPMAAGEVGRVGVSMATIEDMRSLFEGIPQERVSTSMTINATAAILLAMYCVIAEERGVPLKALRGTVQNDILKEYIARKTYIFPPEPSMRLVTDVIRFCRGRVPKWNPISISGYHIREAGATAAQELAFTLANGKSYVRAALRAGLDVDEFAPRLSFFFGAHNHLLEEAAKFRAARRMWARIMREEFGARKETSWRLRFHTQTDGSALTAQSPENNIIRVAYQALAAVLGGTQSLHTNAYDEALSLPSEKGARLALRTQQILACETGVPDTIDPLAGSYCIERLTSELEQKAEEYLDRVEELGGSEKAIEAGYFQREIHQSAYAFQRRMEAGEIKVVGMNAFQDEDVSPQPSAALASLDREIAQAEARANKQLARIRTDRDRGRAEEALAELREVAAGTANLMPILMKCLRAHTSLGEICNTLRQVFGTYQERTEF